MRIKGSEMVTVIFTYLFIGSSPHFTFRSEAANDRHVSKQRGLFK